MSRKSVRAPLTHTARPIRGSLHDGTPSAPQQAAAAENAAATPESEATEAGPVDDGETATSARGVPPRAGTAAALSRCP